MRGWLVQQPKRKLCEFAKRLGRTVFEVVIENDVNRKNSKAGYISVFNRCKLAFPGPPR